MKNFVYLLMIILFGCKKESNDEEKKLAIAALALASTPSKTTACTSSFNCAATPNFSSLATAGTTTSCATSGCHTNAAQAAGLDITDFTATKAFTNPGNPCSSRMYSAITTGAMAGNSNAKINEAVFCWIAGGSNR